MNTLQIWLENQIYRLQLHFFPKTLNNVDDIMMKCYTELFKKAIPSANFQTLMDEAEKNENDQLVIPFMDYEIDENLYYKIVKKYAKRIRPEYRYQAFKNTIALGCSPKFKTNEIKGS